MYVCRCKFEGHTASIYFMFYIETYLQKNQISKTQPLIFLSIYEFCGRYTYLKLVAQLNTYIQYTLILQGLLQKVRPLPSNALHFKGRFLRCHKSACSYLKCTYAHSDLELQAWNKQKEELLNCELSVVALAAAVHNHVQYTYIKT